jgi:tetraprenyl-beta-curcumene synthase
MRTVIRTNNGSAPDQATESRVVLTQPGPAAAGANITEQLELPYVFAETVVRYLLRVLPNARSELTNWRARAAEIPDPVLRGHAQSSLRKQGNIEGAALFATLAPAAHRQRTIRALVAYQTAYNYLDALSEQPSTDPVNNADQLDQALLVALGRGGFESPHPDYYRHNPQRSDGGYLAAVVDACRDALAGLPSYTAVGPAARAAAGRIVDFQALSLSPPHRGCDALESWAIDAAAPAGGSLAWWETAAAAGSSLAVHALIAAAADSRLDGADVVAIEHAYFPWIGALHSLLDSLVDRREDHDHSQRSLLGYYPSAASAAIGLSSLALRGRSAIESLPNPHAHQVIMTAMCSYYLSAPECCTAEAHTITRALTRALGTPLHAAIMMFRLRRLAATLTLGSYT